MKKYLAIFAVMSLLLVACQQEMETSSENAEQSSVVGTVEVVQSESENVVGSVEITAPETEEMEEILMINDAEISDDVVPFEIDIENLIIEP